MASAGLVALTTPSALGEAALSEEGRIALEREMARFIGGAVSVKVRDTYLSFTIDCGPRMECVGGWAGGEHIGVLEKGRMFPRMITGVCAFPAGKFVEVLMEFGWFPN